MRKSILILISIRDFINTIKTRRPKEGIAWFVTNSNLKDATTVLNAKGAT